MNYDLLNQDKVSEGIELARKHLNMVKEALEEIKKNHANQDEIFIRNGIAVSKEY